MRDLSIIMPCLNEAETLGNCILKAQRSIEALKLDGEIIVADNGSTDGSIAIAQDLGARVVHIKEKGYGNALRGGIEAAAGKWIVMADADDRINCSGPCLVVRNHSHQITDRLLFGADAPAIGGFNKLKVKKGCIEILSAQQFKVRYSKGSFVFSKGKTSPLLVTGSFGNGNTAAFAADVAPHWIGPLVDWGDKRIIAKADGGREIEVGNWYARLFINMIRWVSKTERQQNTEAKC